MEQFDSNKGLILIKFRIAGKVRTEDAFFAFEAFGKTKRNFQVLSHQLPVTTFVEGLLGLDFLRKARLTIDFHSGSICLE